MARYTAYHIKNWEVSSCKDTSQVYKPARSSNHEMDSWWQRIKLAWAVLTGKMDALDWEGH